MAVGQVAQQVLEADIELLHGQHVQGALGILELEGELLVLANEAAEEALVQGLGYKVGFGRRHAGSQDNRERGVCVANLDRGGMFGRDWGRRRGGSGFGRWLGLRRLGRHLRLRWHLLQHPHVHVRGQHVVHLGRGQVVVAGGAHVVPEGAQTVAVRIAHVVTKAQVTPREHLVQVVAEGIFHGHPSSLQLVVTTESSARPSDAPRLGPRE